MKKLILITGILISSLLSNAQDIDSSTTGDIIPDTNIVTKIDTNFVNYVDTNFVNFVCADMTIMDTIVNGNSWNIKLSNGYPRPLYDKKQCMLQFETKILDENNKEIIFIGQDNVIYTTKKDFWYFIGAGILKDQTQGRETINRLKRYIRILFFNK